MTDKTLASAASPQIMSVHGVSVSLSGRQILDEVTFGIGPASSPG